MSSAAVATPALSAPKSASLSPLVRGIGAGLLAASIGALYTVFARYGLQRGMAPADMTFIRFGVAGLLMLPLMLIMVRRDGRQLVAKRRSWLAIALLAGPPFGLLMFGALYFAPASHAAVFPFAAMSIMGTVWAAVFLGDRLTARKAVGISVVVSGLVLLSGVDAESLTPRALLGDAMFVLAGSMWAGFGIVMRKQRLDPLQSTAVISGFALVTYVPAYLWVTGGVSLLATPISLLAIQAIVQGGIAGVGTLYTYSKMVALLGAARAAIFPALAPGLAALLAWPILDHVPTVFELGGLTLAIVGLVITVTQRKATTSV